MEKYNLSFKKSTEKELRRVPNPPLTLLLKKIQILGTEPRPQDAVMLKGGEKHFRVRQGDYRIVYEIRDKEKQVVVIKIGHRREVYD